MAQSSLSFEPASLPVTIATEDECSLCVRGMPAYAGTASAELTPGTTSNSTPLSRRNSASSPPREKRKGSPPFRRTTFFPDLASLSMSAVEPVLLFLAGGAGLLAPVDLDHSVRDHAQDVLPHEPVVDHDVRLPEAEQGGQGQEAWVPGTRPHQADLSLTLSLAHRVPPPRASSPRALLAPA